MTEYQFIDRNKDRWKVFEADLKNPLHTHPDHLSEQYISLIDDLSYAQTHFAGSSLSAYLNQLAVAAHRQIYGTRREHQGRIWGFYRHEVPAAFKMARRFFYYALLIFVGATILGWVSGVLEADFLRKILGDEYVNQTIANMEQGDPMAVYSSAQSDIMFVSISANNVQVAFLSFILGVFGGIPTILLLLFNGVMLGAFLQFFAQYGMFGTALTTILLHGAMELTAIVVAGGCGLMLGSAVLFPGTYARGEYVVHQATQALKIILGVVPFILFAAVIESYITRHYQQMPEGFRIALILITFILMVWYLHSSKKTQAHADHSI